MEKITELDVAENFSPFLVVHRDGRIQRLKDIKLVPPSHGADAAGVYVKDVPLTTAAVAVDSGKDVPVAAVVAVRLYLPDAPPPADGEKLPVLVYIHGGAFCIESAFSNQYHDYLLSICSTSRFLCVSVEYSLAPESPLPAAYDDTWVAFKWTVSRADPWLARHGDLSRLFIAGDSAGANLAHNLAVRASSEAEWLDSNGVVIEGLVVVHPFFWFRDVEVKEANEWNEKLWQFLYPSSTKGIKGEPCMNPAADGAPSLAGLCCRRVLVCLAGQDFLLQQGECYYETLKNSGFPGTLELLRHEGEDHVFHLRKPKGETAKDMMERFVAFLHGTKPSSLP